MGKRIRRYLAWALSLVLLMGSSLGGLSGSVAFATDEETVAAAVETPTASAVDDASAEIPAEEPAEEEPAAPEEMETAAPEPTQETEEPTAEPEPTEAPAEEPTEEPTAEPEPTEVPTETPAEEPTEAPLEEVHFSEGYVRLEAGSVVYEAAKEAEELGALKADGIVYAALAKEADDPAEDWLKLSFDTQELRERSAELAVGYVRFGAVEVLTEEETQALTEELGRDADVRRTQDGNLGPCVAFEAAGGAEAAPDADGTEETEDAIAALAEAEFTGFGDTVEYVGGVVDGEYAISTWSLNEDLTVAYVTLLSSALEVGQEASWRVTASGGETPYTFFYCLFRQDLEDTGNTYYSVSGSVLTTTSDTYSFVIPQEGRYLLQFRITDTNGDSLTFQSPRYETPSAELNAKVQEIVSACAGAGKSDYQKALALHDWLCENASYDYSLTIHDPSGVLLQGTGVCESFALAYQMLLTEAGVENVYVTGTANGGGHAWNMVKLDGEWYHVDVTWDEDGTDRYYFGMSTALISRDHVIEDRVPTATATKYNYALNASDGAFASVDELGALLGKLPASQTNFEFYYL